MAAAKASGSDAGIFSLLKKGQPAAAVYDLIFGLNFLEPRYSLLFQDTQIEQLSPGQRGALLLIFYLLVDKGKTPIILDQPEENLDNETVFRLLVPVSLKPKTAADHHGHAQPQFGGCVRRRTNHPRKIRPRIGLHYPLRIGSHREHGAERSCRDHLGGTKPAFENRYGSTTDMAALEPQHMTALKTILAERFVPSLPPLLDTTKPAAEQQAKQLACLQRLRSAQAARHHTAGGRCIGRG